MENRLREYREKSRLTAEELGNLYGETKENCWMLEKNTSVPKLTTAYAIARILGVEVFDIWPDETKVVEEFTILRRKIVFSSN